MYGYPEQFIPEPELVGYGAGSGRVAAQPSGGTAWRRRPKEVTA